MRMGLTVMYGASPTSVMHLIFFMQALIANWVNDTAGMMASDGGEKERVVWNEVVESK